METKIAKFTGTLEMEQVLEEMVRIANNGFSGGKVSKHNLLSWSILYFEKHCFQNCLETIRQDHFDQVTYLESVLKQVKQSRRTGVDIPDLASLLSVISPSPCPTIRKKRTQPLEVPTQGKFDEMKGA